MIKKVYTNLEEGLAVVLVSAICIVVTLQVFCRLVLRDPLSWTEEMSTILFVWLTMVGSSLALKRGEHFAVELLHKRLPAAARRFAAILVDAGVIVFAAILLYEGIRMAVRNVSVATPAMEISRCIPYAAVPVGGLLMLLRSLEMLVRHAAGREGKG
jgi:TRAP-type C4-dicarboxylate transport system permease small subunit